MKNLYQEALVFLGVTLIIGVGVLASNYYAVNYVY
jgi:hypothetical protein